MAAFQFDEKYLSQIPALQLLIAMGYEYLSPAQANAARGAKQSQVLFESVLREQLKKINRISHRGKTHLFSEENIQSAIQRLKNVKYDGLLRTNQTIYDLLTLGISLEQAVDGDVKSFSFNYIDWNNPTNNKFQVTAEFPVERTRSYETCRPDIVLLVNGTPFAIIECKAPSEDVDQAKSQTIRNQRDDYIPRLFTYAQMVIGCNKNEAVYATVGTPSKFWAKWKEDLDEDALRQLIDKPLSDEVKARLFDLVFTNYGVKEFSSYVVGRQPTEQDRALYSLCRPQRLLELAFHYTVFDGGQRKIARYQQYFAVQRIMARIRDRDYEGRRRGGIVWHTQGSGKSLTMVMLARALALAADISNPRIVLVTDRVDLDRQLGNTFTACGLNPERARSGQHLLELVSRDDASVITTLVHKFDKALAHRKYRDGSPDIFVLVDESHRTQLGTFAARMRQLFPSACYIGFSGTPLIMRERSDIEKFGGVIDTYAIDQAVKDQAVVPLLYEARHIEIEQNKKAIDLWFDRHTQGLSGAQRADLKRKYSRAEMLSKTDQVVYMTAFDVSEHFRKAWQSTGAKAQLVAPNKVTALKYKRFLDEIGHVTSEVVISAPDLREGYEEVDQPDSDDEVITFWDRMMGRYGNEEEYNKQIVNQFKYGDDPEILIVVDKLLTGFDAPRNTVLYLCRRLTQHTLLQAIARVNRLYEDEERGISKEFGYIIDYAGVLGDLDQALTTYSALDGFDEAELRGALTGVQDEIKQLPQRHAALLEIFRTVRNAKDEEAYEQLLADPKLRDDFYERLATFGKALSLAMSTQQFVTETPESRLQAYKDDLRKYAKLKAAVKLRYAEAIDYRDYEPRIQKLLDVHIAANEAIRLNEPVNIFDDAALKKTIEEHGAGKTKGAVADMIAHATKRSITERLEQDPAFYEKFSKLIQDAIDEYRARKISELEYLNRVHSIREQVAHRRTDDAPACIRGNLDAIAVFGSIAPVIGKPDRAETVATLSAEIWEIVKRHQKVGYWDDLDAQRVTVNAIDDYLYDIANGRENLGLATAQMDDVIQRVMDLARHRLK